MSVTGSIIAGVGLAGSVGGAAISANAAGNAASTQADAAKSAAQLQAQEAQNSLDFQKQEWNTQQQNMAPWLQAGQGGLSQLQTLLGLGPNTGAKGYGSLNQPFTPPTLDQAKNYPGYQFGLSQGTQAMQNSAAAKGNVFSGNTQEALNNYAQNYAQQDYSNVYNQAFNTFETNQNNTYNRLAALSGLGQQTASTLGQQGQTAANNVSNTYLTTGAQQGQDLQNAGAATASGYIGGANAWSGALGGSSNSLMQMMLLQQMYGGGSGGSVPGGIGSS